ncbi:helix-turn-helix transcriptional regulator [uncultured Sphingomonas sp.]|uniref:helix-turn-helix domain-containing protein n=1 Tax=uncultured Sphingomonas sp. TaxID=158754 RepID=UPI002624D21F|nr:helix-turn-helix transcriptional regulator [uncultured Sphingomonas sp.]
MDLVQLLGENVRQARKAQGMSQEELAFRAGMKRSYLSDLERGTRNPTVRALGRLADALAMSPGTLLELLPRP